MDIDIPDHNLEDLIIFYKLDLTISLRKPI